MIEARVVYARPESLSEALEAWAELSARAPGADSVRYLAGGTEIVPGARKSGRPLAALVDLKRLPELRVLAREGGRIRLGAALSLSELRDSGLFPALADKVRGVADRSVRNRLSLGGNLVGALPYREAALPLLLAGAWIRTARPAASEGRDSAAGPARGTGLLEFPLAERFDRRLALEPGEILVDLAIPEAAADYPFLNLRATRTGPVDYPLVSASFLRAPDRGPEGQIRLTCAFSGLLPHPAAYPDLDAARTALGGQGGQGGAAPDSPVRGDHRASAEYRLALALDMIDRAEEALA